MDQRTYSWNPDDYLKHSCAQYEWAQEHTSVFAKLGFDLEAFGDSTFVLRAIPSMLSGSQAQSMFTDLLQEGIAYV